MSDEVVMEPQELDRGHLKHQIKVRDYYAQHVNFAHLSARMKQHVEDKAAEITAELQDGDELWEWDAGGWQHSAGRSGLAILRGGNVVRCWCLWMS
jgi:hypothetical protein